MMAIKPIIHFIGFRGEEYWSAVKVWGPPHYIHRGWDIADVDLVIFARGTDSDEPRDYNYDDLTEKE